jgi:hypothetical protein
MNLLSFGLAIIQNLLALARTPTIKNIYKKRTRASLMKKLMKKICLAASPLLRQNKIIKLKLILKSLNL